MYKSKILSIFNKFGLDLRKMKCSTNQHYQIHQIIKDRQINTVFDVGGNIGQFATGLRNTGYNDQILSFEPGSEAYEQLAKAASQDENWNVYPQCAVGESMGSALLNVSKNSVSSSILKINQSHLEAAPDSKIESSENVDVVTLDHVINEQGLMGNILLKIDTQGFEEEVLDGVKQSIDKIEVIVCELSLVELYEGQMLALDFIQKLRENGFDLWGCYSGFCNENKGQMLQFDATFVKANPLRN